MISSFINILSSKKLKLNSVSSLQIFNIIRFGTTVLIGILLAKSGLPTGEIAIYEAFLFFSNMVSFFWIGGGQNALLQFFPKLENANKTRIFFNIWVLFLIGSILAATILFLGKEFILNLSSFEKAPPFDLLCLFIVFNTPAWLVHIFYLLQDKHKMILFYGGITFLLQIMVVVCPMWFDYSLQASFLGLTILAVLKFLWSFQVILKHSSLQFNFSLTKKYLILALPLILHVLLGSSVEYIDGLIVTNYYEDDMFAIFRYGAKELPLTLLLIGALAMALIPIVSNNPKEGFIKIKAETEKLAKWLFPLSAFLMFLSPLLFPLFFNSDFKASASVFNIYLLILSSRILLPQVVLIAHQKNYYLVWSAIIEVSLNVILSLWWVKGYGIEGIAFASVVAYLVNKLIMIYFCWKLLKINPLEYINLKQYIFYNSFLFASFFLSNSLLF